MKFRQHDLKYWVVQQKMFYWYYDDNNNDKLFMSVLYADRGDDGADRKKRRETFHFVPPSLLLAKL